jgi:threonine/homoserine/homoserine lactone efflux protein
LFNKGSIFKSYDDSISFLFSDLLLFFRVLIAIPTTLVFAVKTQGFYCNRINCGYPPLFRRGNRSAPAPGIVGQYSKMGMSSMIALFLKGLVLGLSVAAPVGPIGVLCIRRSLTKGPATGFVSGLGAATADACYGAVAAFGLAAVSSFLLEIESALRLGGGLFLIWLGVKTFRAVPVTPGVEGGNGGHGGAFLSCFALTLANPATILSFIALFAGLGFAGSAAGQGSGYEGAAMLVAGVFLGSSLWWLGLSSIAGILRKRITRRALVGINRLSGVVLSLFGLYVLSGLFLPDLLAPETR